MSPPASPLPRRLSFVTGLSLLYLALALILVGTGWRVWVAANQFATDSEWVSHTYQVEGQINLALSHLSSLQTDAAAYAVSGEQARIVHFNSLLSLLDNDLDTLSNMVADNPPQQERARALAKVMLEQRDLAANAIEARRASGKIPANIADLTMGAVRALGSVMLDEEDRLLLQRRVDSEHSAMLTRILVSVAIALCLLFLIVTYWLVRASHARSRRARATLHYANDQLKTAFDNAQRMSETMTRLTQFGEMLQSCRSLEELRSGIGGALAAMLPDHGGRLALISASQNLAAIGAHWGRHGLIAESVFAPEDCWALRRGQPYPLAGSSAGFVCKHVQWPNPDMPDAGYLCVPLAAQGEIIGVLTFDGERAFSADERRIGIAAGEQLALALANLRLQETLRTQSVRDPLTGLFNRRYLEVSLERELMRAGRRALPLAVLMLDIDHFKRFNDSYGHEAGDALLAQFAETLKRTIRAEDIACRYGGEEFTVVLLDADAGGSLARAEEIRAAVSQMSVTHHQQQLPHVTVSIGVALFPRDARSPEDLMRRADAALYAAKRCGRDRVVAVDGIAALSQTSATPG